MTLPNHWRSTVKTTLTRWLDGPQLSGALIGAALLTALLLKLTGVLP